MTRREELLVCFMISRFRVVVVCAYYGSSSSTGSNVPVYLQMPYFLRRHVLTH